VVQDSYTYNGQTTESHIIYGLSNGVIFSDLEWPQTQILRPCHYLTLSISETVQDTDIVNIKILIGTYSFSGVSFQMTLSDLELLSDILNDAEHCTVFLQQLSFLSF